MPSLKLLGGVSLEDDRGPVTGAAAQRHRLALLALLAASRPRGVSRDKLMAWLWPERDAEPARGLLNQATHVLRRALGSEALLSVGDNLQLDLGVVPCDLAAFEEAVAAGDLERAAALYAGPFLDGFFLADAPEFGQWADRERDRLARLHAQVVEGLAEQALAGGNPRRAVELWKARVAHDPYDAAAVLGLMGALAESGHRAAALRQAEAHRRLLREQLGLEAPPEVAALEERIRAAGSERPGPAIADRQAREEHPAAAPAAVATGPDEARPTARLPGRRWGLAVLLAGGAVVLAIAIGRGRGGPAAAAGPAISVDEIAQAVARELARREQGDTGRRSPAERTRSIPAYEFYLRGSDTRLLRSDSTVRLGIDYFRQAIALDSSYAAAWAGLARLTLRSGEASPGTRVAEAEAAAQRALTIDESLAEAHASLGLALGSRLDLAAAERHLRRATELEPGAARHRELLALLYTGTGRAEAGLAAARQAVALEPLSPTANAQVARALIGLGRCDEALAELDRLAGLEPPLARLQAHRAECYAQQGRLEEALAELEPQASLGARQVQGLYGYLLGRAGHLDSALRLLSRIREGGHQALTLAMVYAGLGDTRQASAWMERAVADGSLTPWTVSGITVIAILDSLPRTASVRDVRRRLGLADR